VCVNDVTVTAAQKIIKNSNHAYVRNLLHFKLVKLQSIWKSGSGRICHSKSSKIRLWPDWIYPVKPYISHQCWKPDHLGFLWQKITIRAHVFCSVCMQNVSFL